jgi:hypothetical protein
MAKKVYERPMRCTADTLEWFKRNYSQPPGPVSTQSGASIATIPLEYQAHYSQAKQGCFAVLSLLSPLKGRQGSKSADYGLTHELWDVNENSKLGTYEVRDVEAMTRCDVSGSTCTSKEQWLEMAKPYIAE